MTNETLWMIYDSLKLITETEKFISWSFGSLTLGTATKWEHISNSVENSNLLSTFWWARYQNYLHVSKKRNGAVIFCRVRELCQWKVFQWSDQGCSNSGPTAERIHVCYSACGTAWHSSLTSKEYCHSVVWPETVSGHLREMGRSRQKSKSWRKPGGCA